MRFRSRVATTVVALPLILGVAACGADKADNSTTTNAGGTPTPVITTTAAPPKTAPPVVAQLNRVTFVPAMNSALTKQKSWRITGKVTANGKTVLTMNGVQVAKPQALSIDMTGAAFGGGKAKIIVVRNTAYLSIPGLSPAGKYVKIDAARARDPKVGLGDLLDSGDPTKTFKSFGAALRGVKFVRSETIGGQKLDRYAVIVDTAKVLAALGKAVPADVPKTLTYSLWMDSAHLIRRMSFDLAGVSMLMTMTDFNQPVDISAPPAGKVVSR